MALFELSLSHTLPEDIINIPALQNAVFQQYPEYMVQHNQNELSGRNDFAGRFYQMMGVEVELTGKEENLILLNPDAGTEYLKW